MVTKQRRVVVAKMFDERDVFLSNFKANMVVIVAVGQDAAIITVISTSVFMGSINTANKKIAGMIKSLSAIR